MNLPDWTNEFPAAISVCDKEGVLLSINNKSEKVFEKYGGAKLIGTNILDCHPGDSREKFENLLKTASVNCYIIEKSDSKKFVYQAPWYKDGEYMGITEIVIEIPPDFHTRID
jgi:DUF438 domain-containing protein